MLQSLQLYYVTDQPIYIELNGLVNGGTAVSRIVSNFDYGWESVKVLIRIKTGVGVSSRGSVRLGVASSVNGEFFDTETSGALYRVFNVTLDDTFYHLAMSPDLKFLGPFWYFFVVNNSGVAFNSDSDNFYASYAASKHMLVDRFDFFYKANGAIAFNGDGTETSFPFVVTMSGGLGISGTLRDFAFLPAGKLLRNQISGLASVETFPLPYTEGQIGFSGTFGGPTSNP